MTISTRRLELIRSILEDGANAAEEDEVLDLLLQEHVAQNAVKEYEKDLTFGQRASDNLARFAGSWTFIIIFAILMIAWISLNTYLLTRPYDVYPFILLNLILSCIAAIQAPIIMMSQNRQEQKDRERASNDYKVNLKTEIIIEDLYEKISTILDNQQQLQVRLDLMRGPHA